MATAYNKATGQTVAVNDAAAPASSGSTAAATAEKKKQTVKESMQTYGEQNQANIGKIYDAGIAKQKQSLLDAYTANTAAQDAQRQNIGQTYDEASRMVGTQNAIGNRNLTQFANVRGVNTGTGSQQALNLGNTAARANAVIDFQRQQALQEAERQKQLMTATYQNQVQAAIADNDYKRAAALLDDYQNNQKWQDAQAQILASYGNFDPYKQLYGDTAATAMQKVWQAQNPEVAYRTGAISAETYKNITGRYPAGYDPEPDYGGFYWGPGNGYVPTSGGGGLQLAGSVGFAPTGGGGGPTLTPTAINAAERYK